MDRVIVGVHSNDFEEGLDALHGFLIDGFLIDGFVLDPEFKVVKLDALAIYHLIKYSEEELEAQEVEEEQRIMSIKSVNIEDADELLSQGYTVKDTYAKTVTLIRREVKTE